MGNQINTRAGPQAKRLMRYVVEAWYLQGEELGRYLRSNGIRSEQLALWREQMKEGLEDNKLIACKTRRDYRRKIEKLEKELNEARVIIDIQKKFQKALEAEEENTKKASEKKPLKGSKKE